MSKKRVVITGMGILCPTGNTVAEAWGNAAAGKSGIDYLQRISTERIRNKIGGEVKNFDPVEHLGAREARRADRVTQLALVASRHALEDSGLVVTEANCHDIGCIMGSGVGGLETIVEAVRAFDARGQKAVGPLTIPTMLIDASAAKVSIEFNLRGPNYCLTTACATGNDCIGEATQHIRDGKAKAMVVGSSEAAFTEVAIAGFDNMTAISKCNDPARASRPFDKERDGFVMGEGAAVLVIEDLDFALARGARIYAEIIGYGSTSDAHHITAPIETGEGAGRAMKLALDDAGVTPDEVDYINAHGTSTPLNDKAETAAVKALFGERARQIPMSSTKSVTGHLMGAGGSVEAVFTVMALREGFAPPTINYEFPDPDCDLDYVPNVGRKVAMTTAMSNSFGFGGHNAVLVFRKYTENGAA